MMTGQAGRFVCCRGRKEDGWMGVFAKERNTTDGDFNNLDFISRYLCRTPDARTKE